MVVAANLPKMAHQLCGFYVCLVLGANGSFHQLLKVHLGPSRSSVLAKNLALLGNADLVLGACLTAGWDLGGGVSSCLETARNTPPITPLPGAQQRWASGE